MKKQILFAYATIVSLFIFISCSRDKATPDLSLTDEKLYQLAIDSADENFYSDQAGNTQWTSTQPAHGNGLYKMKLNSKAFAALSASGKLPQNGTFPDSSLIVKKLYSANGSVSLYAVMYKLGGSWEWAEYYPNGDVIFSIAIDHGGCVSCHQPQSRDFVRTFDEHP